jgi:predicted acylesterase/phospholipase RssA
MTRIGLALSGGGFRASLYHLGLVRFLRDAGILSNVSHITSVSGGSILAAHLVLNWDRYNGSPNEFDAAASEFLDFVNLDVRNRITRRFPLMIPLRWLRRVVGRSNRKLTRTGLLEFHYEKYLYGDTSLFELPERPQLHLLATNLSEGCLCSFSRDGLLMVRPQPGSRFHIDHIHVGLATVAMAVTASSAFPGFFPPLELTGADVGATAGEFGRQAYTDGGVFDNLGVRMFRCLERSLLANNDLCADDFIDFPAALLALRQAGQSGDESPLRRIGQVMMTVSRRPESLLLPSVAKSNTILLALLEADGTDCKDIILSNLGNMLRRYQFCLDPQFAAIRPADPDAETLMLNARADGRVLDPGDRAWLNRHLVDAAFRQATGHACFKRLNSGLDGVLVSDVGKEIEVQSNRRAGGLIRTAIRSTDILMDRVWQLEKETFEDTPCFVFAPIAETVEPFEDPTALHPEIQRQTASIRTDLDRFSPLEISSLIRHGYCIGRSACRKRPDLFGNSLPDSAPWDPIMPARGAASESAAAHRDRSGREPAVATREARTLQHSAVRRIWSTMLDHRDWTSYIYVPIVIPILLLGPYLAVKYYEQSSRANQLMRAFAQGAYELGLLANLLQQGPTTPWPGETPQEVRRFADLDYTGYEVLEDARVIDLRNWISAKSKRDLSGSIAYIYRRLKVQKQYDNAPPVFRVPLLAVSPKMWVRFPPQSLDATLRVSHEESADSQKSSRWEVSYDFRTVPTGEHRELLVQYHTLGEFLNRREHGSSFSFQTYLPTDDMFLWILMPEGEPYTAFHITRHPSGRPEKTEPVKVVTEYLAADSAVLAFKLQAVQPGYTYMVSWSYK